MFSAIPAKIQSFIIERDIEMLADPNFIPDTSNTVYIIYMIIGIIGYFTVPTVTGWIIQAGGAGNFMRNVTQMAQKSGMLWCYCFMQRQVIFQDNFLNNQNKKWNLKP